MPQSQLYQQKAQIHIVEETTVDTYIVQTAGGGADFLAEQVEMTIDSTNYEPAYIRGDYLSHDEIPGPASGTMSFRVPIKGGGAAGTAPEYGEALKACGMADTTVGGTSVTYAPVSTFDGAAGNPGQSYSLSWLLNGVRHSIKGAFGTWAINATVGEPAHFEFTFTGAYNAFADDALETSGYQAVSARPFLGATFSTNIGGVYVPLGLENFTLDLGNSIATRRDVNDASGIMGSRITRRKTTGSMDMELVLKATKDWYANWRAGTAGTITTGAIGGTAGNIWTANIARAVCRAPELGDNDGIARITVPFGVSSAGTDVEGTNNDIEFVFT